MIKIFILVAAFFISFVANASTDSKAICPSNITCDYDSGICDMPSGWALVANNGSTDAFSGEMIIGLSQISADKTGFAPNEISYEMACSYKYSEHFFIYFIRTVKTLTGSNWVFSGFGKSRGECSDVTDPNSCSGANQLTNTVEHKKYLQQIYKAASLTEASSSNGYYKYKSISIRGNHTSYSCLPNSESPSGWGWLTEGNRASALPLCACTPGCSASNPHRMCTSCS